MSENLVSQQKLRNVAIIAHVDHGKTTLVDAFMKQTHLFRENQEEMNQTQILDSGDLEREKGITIKAKNISVFYEGHKINIIDTPGHADFGGEVERTLNMADGCILVVDAQEGVMPQTRFVLRKALELKLKPIVLINKIDKKLANCKKTLSKVQDLFLNLATEESQLEFPVLYAIAREGKVFTELPTGDLTIPNSLEGNMKPLLDKIIEYIPHPQGEESQPLQMQVCDIEYDSHVGRYLIGKIFNGKIKNGDNILLIKGITEDGEQAEAPIKGQIKNLLVRTGLKYEEVPSASAGEIVAISGIDIPAIGYSVCSPSNPQPLPAIKITPPTLKIKFEPNTSPLKGKDGQFVNPKQLQQRLEAEVETNVSLKIEKGDGSSYYISGRGELQLSILMETLRREGYEFQIRKPEVVIKEIDGAKYEPIEEVYITTTEEYVGTVTRELGLRKAELLNVETEADHTQFTYKILTRNLIGLRNILINETRGNAVVNSMPVDYVPSTEDTSLYRKGVIISLDNGTAMGYSLNSIQERGTLFIEPGTEVYEGMIIGVNKYEQDIEVNPTKERQKSNVRMKHDEITQTALKGIQPLTLESALVFLGDDEILEVTPNYLRLRKALLTHTERQWAKRTNLSPLAKQKLGLA